MAVGVTDRIDDSARAFCHALEVPFEGPLKTRNVSQESVSFEDQTEEIWKLVREATALDVRLYERAKAMLDQALSEMASSEPGPSPSE